MNWCAFSMNQNVMASEKGGSWNSTWLIFSILMRFLTDADLQIAATAIYHDLELVSGNLRHFSRITELKINPILANARSGR